IQPAVSTPSASRPVRSGTRLRERRLQSVGRLVPHDFTPFLGSTVSLSLQESQLGANALTATRQPVSEQSKKIQKNRFMQAREPATWRCWNGRAGPSSAG